MVVIHDPTLDRTTTGTGPVVDRTAAELRALRLKDRSQTVTAEGIPTLDEVAALAAAGGRRLLLEIKVDSGKARYPGIEEPVLRDPGPARHGRRDPCHWPRSRRRRGGRVRAPARGPRGCTYSARAACRPAAAVSRALSEAARPGSLHGPRPRVVTPEAVAEARKGASCSAPGRVNEPDCDADAHRPGDGVRITDRPDVAKNLLTQRRSP